MRPDFSSSKLVRLLGPLAEADTGAPGMDFSERLGLWVNAFDAIGLQSAQQSIRAMPTAAGTLATTRKTSADTLRAEVQQARTVLARAIAQPVPVVHEAKNGYTRYQHRHQDLQRTMEQMIRALRDHVRQTVSAASPRMRQLAALDAVLEHLIAPREQALLPRAASLLERRWRERQAVAAGNGDGEVEGRDLGAADAQAQADDEAFADEWRQALSAELDLRLEPVTGLVEALAEERNTHR